MFFKKLVVGPLETNCYILSGDGKNALVIDAADDFPSISKTLENAGLVAAAVFLTHGHLDHTNAVKQFQAAGAVAYMHKSDVPIIADHFGYGFPGVVEKFVPDKNLSDGEILKIANLEIKVIHTPGHSAGSVCFLIEDMLFSGDTLFYKYVGRTDFPTGDNAALTKSIREKLYILPPDTKVYPGHGQETTIGRERISNQFVRDENAT